MDQMASKRLPKTSELDSLSYQIIGICFSIHNRLGNSYKEVYYQRAFEKELKHLKIRYEREKSFDLTYRDETIGKHFVDFLIDDKIVVEFKAVPYLTDKASNQILSYLKSMQKRLGLLINFRTNKVQVKRIVLPDRFVKQSD
jgi:GxxExxY protein